MILPLLNGLSSFWKAPVTWVLLVLNTVIWMATYQPQENTHKALQEYYDQEGLVKSQGEIFAEYISKNAIQYDGVFLRVSDLALSGSIEHKMMLGKLALRDRSFASHALDIKTEGDEVLLRYWQEKYQKIREVLDRDPVNTWGLGMGDTSAVKWLTYQFLHGGFFHLISNMWFLLIFGCFLEPLIGGALFLLIYLASGFFAAGVYIELTGISGIPLVGASGAISGLMGVIVAYYGQAKIRYLYWILPVRGYSGFIMLPAWLLLVVWGASDLAGYFSTIRELGGIAHAAHIGGALHGLVIGLLLRIWGKSPSHGVLSHTARL